MHNNVAQTGMRRCHLTYVQGIVRFSLDDTVLICLLIPTGTGRLFCVYGKYQDIECGELIGTFEDSAAVAGSIVIEEYMAQLIEDTVVKQQAVCPPTEESVQAFTRELLVGFNWQLFQSYFPLDTLEKVETLPEKITAMIFDAFVSTQPQGFDSEAHGDDLEKWIRSAIVIPFFTATGAIRKGPSVESAWTTSKPNAEADQTSSKKRNGKAKRRTRKKKSDIVEAPVAASPPSIRLSVKANPCTAVLRISYNTQRR